MTPSRLAISMNSPSFNPELSAEELEETVELPILPDGVIQAADGETAELKAVAETEAPAAPRGGLESNLRSLTDNLRTLEERLRMKSEQLSVFEREVGARDRRIAELEASAARREQDLKEAGISTASLLEQIGGLSGRLADAEASSQQHAGAHAQIVIEQTSREFALSHAMARLADLNTRAERFAEVRQTLEGQRHVYEGMVGERDAQIESAQEQLAALQAQLTADRRQATAQAQALQADLDFQRDRATDFERQILQAQSRIDKLGKEARQHVANAKQAAVRQQTLNETLTAEKTLVTELNGSVEGLRRDNAGVQTQLAATRQSLAKVETELRNQRDVANALQEQLSAAGSRADKGVADLAAAEERLRTTEGELRQRDAKIELLAGNEAQLREHIAQLGHSLDERKAVIDRLEGEAASSAAVVDLLRQEARQHIANAEQAAMRQQTMSETLAAEKTLVTELNGSVEGLRRDNVSAQAQLAVTMRSIVRLETELRDHRDLAEAQQEQLSVARLRADNGAADLAAAEERLRATENESRQRETRIELLLVSETQLREKIAQLELSLGERNALIGRLEGEAASSAAVLGNIQHNLETLGNEAAKQTSQSGSHAIPRFAGEKLARLFVRSKGETGIVHVLGRKTTIGRTPDNDLQIDAESISRHHAVVLYTNDATVIEDLNSTNGVFVNGSKVNRCTLAEGDTVTIGVTTFRFVLKPVTDRATQN